ncbi:MAG: helix-turn-helix domain-containing protein [Chloroflexi bacterium]|nr:helix-turn-helix domain-containing protein [Chloroflexota bacterium]
MVIDVHWSPSFNINFISSKWRLIVTQPNGSTKPDNVTSRVGQTKQAVAQPISPDELLTIAEVAIYLKLSRRTAWRWCKSGQLPAVKVGHQWRVTRRDLENFVRRRGKMIL